jgi:hypothetical protein
MPTTRTKRMCIACHWRKFHCSPIGKHPAEAVGANPAVCGTCKASVYYLYPCDCKKSEMLPAPKTTRKKARR